jgi:hypothetical protein
MLKSTLLSNDTRSLGHPEVNVTTNGFVEYAISPPTATLIGLNVAPTGTVTVSDVVVAPVTVAFVAPKYTTLFDGVALKFVPVIVTVVPIGPDVGVKNDMVGAVCPTIVLASSRNAVTRRTRILFLLHMMNPRCFGKIWLPDYLGVDRAQSTTTKGGRVSTGVSKV